VRDTRDDEVIRHCLTAYYSEARYEILNTGGMLYQFVGDEVSGLFGVPRPTADYLRVALACARALVDIGNSISHEGQRQIDRVQSAKGVHIGIAMGEVQFVSLRPYRRAHLGAVSDAINMAARPHEVTDGLAGQWAYNVGKDYCTTGGKDDGVQSNLR
jgi:adenylate cyclase